MVVVVRIEMTIAIAPEAMDTSTAAVRMVLMVTATVDIVTGMMIVAVVERTTTAAAATTGVVSIVAMMHRL